MSEMRFVALEKACPAECLKPARSKNISRERQLGPNRSGFFAQEEGQKPIRGRESQWNAWEEGKTRVSSIRPGGPGSARWGIGNGRSVE